jgi:CBS domain containing-hemolysin-like protein
LVTDIFIILVSLLFSTFFAGMETAFLVTNKLRIERVKKQGGILSHIIGIFTQNPSQYIATMMIGSTLSLVVFGIWIAKLLAPPIAQFISYPFGVLTLQIIISTAIILITAEFLPKAIFRKTPNLVLNLFAIPVLLFYISLYPVSSFTLWFSNKMVRIFFGKKSKTDSDRIIFRKIDLDNFENENTSNKPENKDNEHDIRIFQNALDFSSVKLRECIVPRTELAALEINSSLEALRQKFIETGFSKILVYEDNIDNIVGYIHSSEMFKKPDSLRSCLNKIPIVPETMAANKLLETFIQQRKSIALVVDEFGGTAGIVTIEDIMEEIFGEINDEFDNDDIDHTETKISDKEYILAGRLEIDYLNEKYNFNIPESDDYETIAGYIINQHESIPNVNETIRLDNFTIKVIKATSTRIQLINLKMPGNEVFSKD